MISDVSNLINLNWMWRFFLINELTANNNPMPRPEWNSFYRILPAALAWGNFIKKWERRTEKGTEIKI